MNHSNYPQHQPKVVALKQCTNCRFYRPVLLFRQRDNGLCTLFRHEIGDVPATDVRQCTALCGIDAKYHIEGPICEPPQLIYLQDVVQFFKKMWKFLIAVLVLLVL
jgi:hypothetical protein